MQTSLESHGYGKQRQHNAHAGNTNTKSSNNKSRNTHVPWSNKKQNVCFPRGRLAFGTHKKLTSFGRVYGSPLTALRYTRAPSCQCTTTELSHKKKPAQVT